MPTEKPPLTDAKKLDALFRSQGVPLVSRPAVLATLSDKARAAITAAIGEDGVVSAAAVTLYQAALDRHRVAVREAGKEKGTGDGGSGTGEAALPVAPNPADQPQTPVPGAAAGPQMIDEPAKKPSTKKPAATPKNSPD